jgi:hypothetical protein
VRHEVVDRPPVQRPNRPRCAYPGDGSAAGGGEDVRERLVEPLLAEGWSVAITLTPTVATWLAELGADERLADIGCYAVVPVTANTVATSALGLAENQGLTAANEAIGGRSVPVIVVPRVNACLAGHPAWEGHPAALRSGHAAAVGAVCTTVQAAGL